MTPAAAHRLGVILIAVTAVLWGTSGTAATFAPQVGPLAIGAAALGIGGLLQGLISIGAQRRAAPRLRAHAGVVAIGALTVAIYPLAFYSSMRYAGVAVGTVISLASAPLASGLLDRFIDHRRLGPWWTAAAGMGVVARCCCACPEEETTPPGPVERCSACCSAWWPAPPTPHTPGPPTVSSTPALTGRRRWARSSASEGCC